MTTVTQKDLTEMMRTFYLEDEANMRPDEFTARQFGEAQIPPVDAEAAARFLEKKRKEGKVIGRNPQRTWWYSFPK